MLNLDGSGPIHRQVYAALRAAILSGELAPGARLPSTRALAATLGLSRTTTHLAYEQLMAEGYAAGRIGSGTYVAANEALLRKHAAVGRGAPAQLALRAPCTPRLSALGRRAAGEVRPLLSSLKSRRPPPRFDFRYGLHALDGFPHQRWRRLVGRQIRNPAAARYDYPEAQGLFALRQAIAGYLRRARGLPCAPERIVVVNGSQQAIDLCARLLLDPGDVAVVEEPGYEGARNAFALAGARLVGAPVDDDGIDIDAAPPLARRARLAYVTPSHQVPTGGILSLSRRIALLDWAERTGALLVEDDYDGEYRFEGRPIAPLQALDERARVLYVGTFSKVMFPALRLGYLVLPEALVPTFARAKALADGGTPVVFQEALAEFIDSGSYERHVRRSSARLRERREALLEAVVKHLGPEASVIGAAAGLHVLLRLPGFTAQRSERLARRAIAAGVGLYSAAPYFLTPRENPGFLLGYGALRPTQIRLGIRKLGEILAAEAAEAVPAASLR
jgi:GntR family transcriptional regulator/MocR family aminotransferase